MNTSFDRICRKISCGLAVLLCAPFVARAERLTLLDCLRQTAAHNTFIIQQQWDIERAYGSKLTFRSRALPNLAVGLLAGDRGAQDSQVLVNGAIRDSNGQITQRANRQTSLRPANNFLIGTESLSQPIFDAGIPAAWRRGSVEVDVSKANFAVVAVRELNLAHTLFLQALFAQQNEVILREINASRQANVQTTMNLFKAGLVNRQSLLAAQVELSNSEPAINAAVGNYRGSLTQLLRVMGRALGPATPGQDPVETTTLTGTLGDAPTKFDPSTLGRAILERRPDLVALRETVRQLREDTNTVRAGYYPLIKVFVNSQALPENVAQSGRTNSVRPSDENRTTEADFGVREDWMIIDTGTVRGEINRIEYLRRAVEISLRQAERMIPNQLAQIQSQWASAQKQVEQYGSNVAAAQNTLETTRASLAKGLVSQLDFLNVQNDVAYARTGLLNAQYQTNLARAEFDRVTNGYLRYASPNLDPAPARHR